MPSGLLGDGASSHACDIHAFFDSGIPGLIAGLIEMGILVSIGSTRDRGAVSLTVTRDGSWDREYFRTSADAEDWLRRATAILSNGNATIAEHEAPFVPASRRRRQKLT